MNAKSLFGALLIAFLFLFLIAALPATVSASHSWNGYHWARTINPFTLKLGNNTSGTWTNLLTTASSDWSQSTVLDTVVVAGGTNPKSCRPTSGQDQVCSTSYGNTGWLGLAQIWITGGVHITQGTVKLNDYYFGNSTYAYNNEAEKLHVVCQEVGHTFGLAHQDETGISLNTCMDYYHNTNNLDTQSTHPNQHDYDELVTIYTPLDTFTTVGSSSATKPGAANDDFDAPEQWGKVVEENPRYAVYERDFGNGNKLVTRVIWATSSR
ncbi:MAG: hypothetical protein HY257_12025 [Chloroflexi bacterium]|nr:hypothetical protein [Chloroflexota bacterium]